MELVEFYENGFTYEVQTGSDVYVFDWNKAACLIRQASPSLASVVVDGHIGVIYRNKKIVRPSLCSTISMSRPTLFMNGSFIDCCMPINETIFDGYDMWPPSSLMILRGDI